jgi:beta-ribofuranosylaminobenzene 5'-phosphate synthase
MSGRARQVTVETGARLHFGFLSLRPTAGRQFGGIGVMVDQPRCVIRLQIGLSDELPSGTTSRDSRRLVERAALGRPGWTWSRSTDLIDDDELPLGQRIDQALAAVAGPLQQRLGPSDVLTSGQVDLLELPPAHRGYGSGTQLALAIAQGAVIASGLEPIPAVQLAEWVGRGQRSAIGTHGFDQGGWLVDAGRLPNERLSPLAVRLEFPPAWRFVLISTPQAGLSGTAERQAFEQGPRFSEDVSGQLSRLVLTELLPALGCIDCERFSLALGRYGRLVGEQFAASQGGVFSDPRLGRLADQLHAAGYPGAVQTSWGPTICLPCESETAAMRACDWIREHADQAVQLGIAAVRNHGARISV